MQNEQLKKDLETALDAKYGAQVKAFDVQEKENLLNLFSDEEFLEQLFSLDELADVKKLLREKGVEMTDGQLMEIKDQIVKQVEGGGEISDASMERVAGGVMDLGLGYFIMQLAAGAAAGYYGDKHGKELYKIVKKKVSSWGW